MKFIKHYKEAKDELGKVIFPTKTQVRNAYISVVVVVTVVTLFLALVDVVLRLVVSNVVS